MSESGKAVFLSYASQDAAAAKRIADTLRAAGVEVWFDAEGGLEHGDEWDAKIRRQIKECVLFIPIISAHTEEREEGYFRIEWELAAQRALGIASGVAFILPVVIDDTREQEALVPDRFRTVQWTRLSGGEVTSEVKQRFLKLWSHRSGVEKHRSRESPAAGGVDAGDSSPRAQSGSASTLPRWIRPILASALIVIAVLAYTLVRRHEPPAAVVPPVVPAPAPAVSTAFVSPARQLAERAWTIVNQGSATRAQLDAAVELCDRALQLDPTDAMVWARAAAADLALIYPYGYDRSDERRRRAQDRAAHATSLGADLVEVRVIQAMVLAHAVRTPTLLAEAEKTLRELIPVHPELPKLTFQLAEILRAQNRFAEAARLFESIGEFEVAGWSYHQAGELQSALAAVERSLRGSRSVTALQLKAILQMSANEDLAAAQATIDQLQPSELLAEMPAAIAIKVAFFRRDPTRMLEIARGLGQDYLDSNAFRGPRQYYTGIAHELAGRPGQAAAEWRTGLAVVETRLKAAPNDRQLLLWSAWLHAALGDAAEAERLFAHTQAMAGLSGDTMDGDNVQVLLRLRRADALLAGSEAIFKARTPNWEVVHAEMRFSPLTDWLRSDPRFQKQLRDNLPPGAQPLDDQKTEDGGQKTAAPVVDQKSVAVLAFANLSDDKANEYFSDGISEELLNVLAKVPGLKVTARTSAFYFKGKDVPVAEIAQKLGVAYLVEGSVRKAGNKVRISAQLIKAVDGFQVWSEDFDRELKDVFAVQDEIAGLVARNLQLKLEAPVRAAALVNPEAYQFYLQGRQALQPRTMAGFHEAEKWFNRAKAIAPNWAPPYAALADALRLRAWSAGSEPTGPGESWPPLLLEAKALGEQALTLDPNLSDAYVALAGIYMLEWNFPETERLVQRALELNPNEAAAYLVLGRLYAAQGRLDEAITALQRGAKLNPLASRILDNLAAELNFAGRYEEGWNVIQRAAALQPDGSQIQCYQARLLASLGRREEALQMADTLLKNPEVADIEMQRVEAAAIFSQFGRQTEAEALVAQTPVISACYPVGLAYIGKTDAAAAALDRINFGWIEDVLWGRTFDPIRRDPRLVAWQKRVGLTEAQARANAWRAAHGLGPISQP